MADIPSKYVAQRVHYGEKRKHFYSGGDPLFCGTKEEAEAHIIESIKSAPGSTYLLLKVEALFQAGEIKVEQHGVVS